MVGKVVQDSAACTGTSVSGLQSKWYTFKQVATLTRPGRSATHRQAMPENGEGRDSCERKFHWDRQTASILRKLLGKTVGLMVTPLHNDFGSRYKRTVRRRFIPLCGVNFGRLPKDHSVRPTCPPALTFAIGGMQLCPLLSSLSLPFASLHYHYPIFQR